MPTRTCATCGRPITHTTVDEPGFLTRKGWSDGSSRDALACFSALNYRHRPAKHTTP